MNPEIPGNPMMERNDNSSPRVLLHILVALAIFVGTFLAIAGAAGAFCFFAPRQYYSKAIVEVKPEDYDRSAAYRGQLFLSKGILYPIIDNLKLVEAWSEREGGKALPKEEVYLRLIKNLEVTSIRNTDLIQIGVYSVDNQEAANIANMIAVVFRDVCRNDQMQMREAALAQFKQELTKRRKDVEAAQLELQKMRERAGIVDPNPESMDAQAIPQNQNYLDAKQAYIKDKRVLEQAETRLSTYRAQLQTIPPPVKIWEKAEPATCPSKPNVVFIMFVALAAGAFSGFILAGIYLIFALRPKVKGSLPETQRVQSE